MPGFSPCARLICLQRAATGSMWRSLKQAGNGRQLLPELLQRPRVPGWWHVCRVTTSGQVTPILGYATGHNCEIPPERDFDRRIGWPPARCCGRRSGLHRLSGDFQPARQAATRSFIRSRAALRRAVAAWSRSIGWQSVDRRSTSGVRLLDHDRWHAARNGLSPESVILSA